MRGRWGPRPRRRPPWWPEDQGWPPDRGWGRRGPPPFIRWIGCLFLAALAVAALAGGLVGALVGRLGFLPVITVALLFVLMVAAGVTGGFRRMTRPMDDLIDAAGRVEKGDYAARVPERGPRELRSVARAFNAMSAKLKSSDEQRRSFLADVAHELRTPLSVIRGQAEAIADGVYPGDADHLAPILDATDTLDRLVEDLRTLVLTDAGSLVLNRERVDIGVLVNDALASFKPQAEAAGVTMTAEIGEAVPVVDADPARIRSVIGNLLSNGIRHTPAGGSVRVGVQRAGDKVILAVTDTGEGIPPELLPHVFDRFVKAPESTGSGLGLAIAHDIVNAHGGTIEIKSAVGTGTTVRLTLTTTPP